MDSLASCEAYCEDRLAHPDSDYPLLRVFLDEDAWRVHAGLQALRLELLDISHTVSDGGVATSKLRWWREELLRFARDEARHPVTRLLSGLPTQVSPEALLHMTLAVEELLRNEGRWDNFDALYAHCLNISGTAAGLEAGALGLGDDARAAAQQIGAAAHLTRLIANLPADAVDDRVSVPMDELARFQVTRAQLREQEPGQETEALLSFQRQRACALYREALEALSPQQRHALLAWTIRANLDQARLSGPAGNGLGLSVSPLRRLWLAWRTASRTRRQALNAIQSGEHTLGS